MKTETNSHVQHSVEYACSS